MLDETSRITQVTTHQLLETIFILENSKAVDTVIGRIPFYLECVDYLKHQCKSPKYISNIQNGLDYYKSLYYDRVPTELSILILTNPISNIHSEFIGVSIYNSFGRAFAHYVDAIKTLTKVTAKEKRKIVILHTLELARNEITNHCIGAKSYQKIIDSMRRIEELIITRENLDDIDLICD